MLKAMHRALRGGSFLCLLVWALTTLAAGVRGEDSWDAIFVGPLKVGHNHIHVEPTQDKKDPSKKYLLVQVNTVLSFARGRDRTEMELRYGTIETLDGEVLKLETRTRVGNGEIRLGGLAENGQMHLVLSQGGQQRDVTIPWGPDVRGPYGAEQSLAREPLKAGEGRDIRIFVPDLNQVITTHLLAKQEERVALGGGEARDLLRVQQTFTGADGKAMPEMETTFWVDKEGQVLKSHSALLNGMDMYRTTKQFATAPNDRFDLMAATIVKTKPITDSERRRYVRYRVTLQDLDPKEVFANDRRQSLRLGPGPGQAILEVRTAASNRVDAGQEKLDPAYLKPNPLVDSEDSEVLRHTQTAIGKLGNANAWTKAVAIENWVFKNMTRKNFSNAFAPADEVARNLEGDCTEHGVLVAAMCRAAGIPCRCCVGFVYAEEHKGFGHHLWNEVYIDGRWVAIDAAFNQAEVDATHIKLADTSLDGVAPFEPFLPVIRLFGKLKLEPIEVQ
jgi:hypothetical protein